MTGKYWGKGLQLVDGCTEVSPGCDNCWSRQMARFERTRDLVSGGKWTGELRLNEQFLDRISRTKKPTVFAIWNDLFHHKVPHEYQIKVVSKFVDNPHHTGLFLTKRPDMMALFWECWEPIVPPNIWNGTTIENQEQIKRLDDLVKCPGNLWVSIEPMLAEIIIPPDILNRLDCVVLGGETGPRARPTNPDWVRKVRDDCEASGIPFFFKQWGEWLPAWQHDATGKQIVVAKNQIRKGRFKLYYEWMNEEAKTKYPACRGHEFKTGGFSFRVGRKNAGRILDGRTHDELPWRA